MAKTTSRRKNRITFVLVAILVLSGVGVAFAYWTSTGTGEGPADTGTSAEFTIESIERIRKCLYDEKLPLRLHKSPLALRALSAHSGRS